jgi:hypothetical protein
MIYKRVRKALYALFMGLLLINPAWANDPILPNAVMTPGEIDTSATLEKVCTSGYSASVRNVPQSKKDHVYELYGITPVPNMYEVDHLISLQLGGTNSMRNLWPQAYFGEPWNARVKDDLENVLRRMVCDGKIPLNVAQNAIATNWIVAYCTYNNKKPGSCNDYMNSHEYEKEK